MTIFQPLFSCYCCYFCYTTFPPTHSQRHPTNIKWLPVETGQCFPTQPQNLLVNMTHGRETTSLTPPSKNEIHSLNFIMHGSNDLDSPVEIMSSIAICEKYQSIYIHLQLNLKTEFTYLYKDLRIRNCITGCVHTASSIVLRTLCPTLH